MTKAISIIKERISVKLFTITSIVLVIASLFNRAFGSALWFSLDSMMRDGILRLVTGMVMMENIFQAIATWTAMKFISKHAEGLYGKTQTAVTFVTTGLIGMIAGGIILGYYNPGRMFAGMNIPMAGLCGFMVWDLLSLKDYRSLAINLATAFLIPAIFAGNTCQAAIFAFLAGIFFRIITRNPFEITE